MRKRIALVSGGTSGIGLSLVRELIQKDFFVYFIGSNLTKGESVEAELNKTSICCEFIQLDLSNLKEVKKFTITFQKKVSHLDLLANIAGVLLPYKTLTTDGFDKTFVIGYLAAFLLSNELTPLLLKVKYSRIINMGGRPAQVLKRELKVENLGKEQRYNPVTSAFNTIHAKTVMTQTLSQRLKETGVTVNSFSPGPVRSDLGQNMPLFIKLFFKILKPFMNKKSKSAIYTALSEELNKYSGNLIINQKPHLLRFNRDYADQLWSKTEEIIKGLDA
jgi:NAD(P)-dependent dehydrogenase (short-subunit alcohol dehydrogenase family)